MWFSCQLSHRPILPTVAILWQSSWRPCFHCDSCLTCHLCWWHKLWVYFTGFLSTCKPPHQRASHNQGSAVNLKQAAPRKRILDVEDEPWFEARHVSALAIFRSVWQKCESTRQIYYHSCHGCPGVSVLIISSMLKWCGCTSQSQGDILGVWRLTRFLQHRDSAIKWKILDGSFKATS